jgi:tetratricopeptide (TPR) repeat protein
MADSKPKGIDLSPLQVRKGGFPRILLAAGVLRLAQELDRAEELLGDSEGRIPAEWRNAWANERGALAWERGQADKAEELWSPLSDHLPGPFNLGLAALFGDRPLEARSWLSQAVALLPEVGSWYHLAKLYITLAEMRIG